MTRFDAYHELDEEGNPLAGESSAESDDADFHVNWYYTRPETLIEVVLDRLDFVQSSQASKKENEQAMTYLRKARSILEN